MIDRELVEEKFDIIDRNLDFLEEFKKIDKDLFLKSYKDIQAVKYSLLEIIECCIDIANHIISAKGFRRAEEYREIFEILGEEKVINKNIASRLQDMASFRNLLVYRYGEIDNLTA